MDRPWGLFRGISSMASGTLLQLRPSSTASSAACSSRGYRRADRRRDRPWRVLLRDFFDGLARLLQLRLLDSFFDRGLFGGDIASKSAKDRPHGGSSAGISYGLGHDFFAAIILDSCFRPRALRRACRRAGRRRDHTMAGSASRFFGGGGLGRGRFRGGGFFGAGSSPRRRAGVQIIPFGRRRRRQGPASRSRKHPTRHSRLLCPCC